MFSIKVTGKGSLVGINGTKFSQTATNEAEEQLRQCARVYLREVLQHIPTYTGAARGTFKPIGRALRVAVPRVGPMGVPGNAARAKQKKVTHYKGRIYDVGFENGQQYGHLNMYLHTTKTQIRGVFQMTQNLPYVLHNDLNGLRNVITAPWHYHEQGMQAVNTYVDNAMPRQFPKMYRKNIKFVPFKIQGWF